MVTEPTVASEEAAQGRARRGRVRRWLIDVGILVVAIAAITIWQSRGHARGDAPPFSAASLHGERFDNAGLRGQRTLLVFWAPWCGVCRLESPNVSTVQALVGDSARVLSVASEYDDIREVEAWVAAHDVDYPVLLGGNRMARSFGVSAFPTAFLLDAEGRITASVTGYTTTFGLLWRLLL